jgi:hypothetical protein
MRIGKYRILILLILLSLIQEACNSEHNNEIVSSKVGKLKTVLVLGNSILQHGPDQTIGWSGNWGMAATCIDSDFVHRLIRDIKQKDSSVQIKFRNIAGFERNYRSFDLSSLDSLKNPDLLIMRIGENVDNEQAMDSNFIAHYDELIKFLDSKHQSVRLITDGFWENRYVNGLIRAYSEAEHDPFISIRDLSKDSTNRAGGKFSNQGVALHPSDKGMKMIEERIWNYVKHYF